MKILTESPTKRTGTVRPPALLVVEDDADDFMLLKRALYKAGATARVWWARDGAEALALLPELERAECRICVVMDVRLTGRDGWELLIEIKRRPESHQVKFAFLTGMNDRGTEARASELGADAFFVKPCDATGLIPIARALQKLATG